MHSYHIAEIIESTPTTGVERQALRLATHRLIDAPDIATAYDDQLGEEGSR